MLPQNEGALDRTLRVIIGLALVAVLFTLLSGVVQIIAGVIAAILIVTGLVGFCPLYALFRINSRGRKNVASRA